MALMPMGIAPHVSFILIQSVIPPVMVKMDFIYSQNQLTRYTLSYLFLINIERELAIKKRFY